MYKRVKNILGITFIILAIVISQIPMDNTKAASYSYNVTSGSYGIGFNSISDTSTSGAVVSYAGSSADLQDIPQTVYVYAADPVNLTLATQEQIAAATNVVTVNVNTIADTAFQNQTGITNVVIPNAITTVGSKAFDGCTSLAGITIPSQVITIADDAFNGCTGLISITGYYGSAAETAATTLSVTFNALGGTSGDFIIQIVNDSYGMVIGYSGSGGNITIPSSYTDSGSSPKTYNVTKINGSAFYNSTAITGITIPDTINEIGSAAFEYCSGITTDIIIPDSVTSIGDNAFMGCTNLDGITIPYKTTSIGTNVFKDCASTVTIYGYAGSAAAAYADTYDYLTFSDTIASGTYYAAPYLYSYNTSSKTAAITDYTGTGGPISIPSSITIGSVSYAVTEVGDSAFKDCTTITGVTVPTSVTDIGDSAFSGCSALTTITIPYTVSTIGSGVFTGCNGGSITGFNISGFIGTAAKTYTTSLGCVFTATGAVSNGFVVSSSGELIMYTGSATSITVPASVSGYTITSIGSNAFKNLAYGTVSLPDTIATIATDAFPARTGTIILKANSGTTTSSTITAWVSSHSTGFETSISSSGSSDTPTYTTVTITPTSGIGSIPSSTITVDQVSGLTNGKYTMTFSSISGTTLKEKLSANSGTAALTSEDVLAMDIKLTNNNSSTTPTFKSLRITMKVPDDWAGDGDNVYVSMYDLTSGGVLEQPGNIATLNKDNVTYIQFTTTHFSDYALVYTKTITTTTASSTTSASSGGSSSGSSSAGNTAATTAVAPEVTGGSSAATAGSTQTSSRQKDNSPKTGDNVAYKTILVCSLFSLGMILLLTGNRKKREVEA